MNETSTIEDGKNEIGFIRLGGLLILLGLTVHIVVNMVFKTFPQENLTFPELQEYLLREKGIWSIVHGLRYVAIVCIVVFSAALFVKTSHKRSTATTGWGIVGLLGTALMMANLMITNGIEILAFYNFHRLSEKMELFWLLFNLTRVLFTTEIVAWALLIFGFSMAGWYSVTIPKWLVMLGVLSAFACLLSSVFVIHSQCWFTLFGDK